MKLDRKKHILTDDMIFCEHSKVSAYIVKQRFLDVVEYKCKICGIKEWQGQSIKLDMDHINGNSSDDRIENLRLLCPNCHSLTETYKSKNKKTLKITEEQIIAVIPETANARQALMMVGLAPRGGNYTRIYRLIAKYGLKFKEGPNKICTVCGAEISTGCEKCVKCYAISREIIAWPPRDELERMVWAKPSTDIAEELGVSDSAIKKRCRKLGIKKPGKGYWQKLGALGERRC